MHSPEQYLSKGLEPRVIGPAHAQAAPAHTGHQAQTRIEPRDIAHVTPRCFRYGRKVPTYRIGEFARAARHPEAAASADPR